MTTLLKKLKGPMKQDTIKLSAKESSIVRVTMVTFLLTSRPTYIVQDFQTEQSLNALVEELKRRAQIALHKVYPKFVPSEVLNITLDIQARRLLGQVVQETIALKLGIVDENDIAKTIANAYKDYKNRITNDKKGKGIDDRDEAAASATTTNAITDAPLLRILTPSQVHIIKGSNFGIGAFGTVKGVHIMNVPSFVPNKVYAAKTLHASPCALQVLLDEAMKIPKVHPGIVRPLAIVHNKTNPMLIMDHWNGGTIKRWFYLLSKRITFGSADMMSSGSGRPPWFHSEDHDSIRVQLVKNNILNLVSAFIRTMFFLHDARYMHNDLHPRNVLLHFPTDSDEVYLGIIDWGMCCKIGASERYPPQTVRDGIHHEQLKLRYPHVAPECLSATPPPRHVNQDIFSMAYIIRKLLVSWIKGKASGLVPDQNRIVQRVITKCNEALHCDDPNERPSMQIFDNMMHHVVKIDKNVELRT